MSAVPNARRRGLLALLAALALAVGACSGSSATTGPGGATKAPGATDAPAASVDNGAAAGDGLAGAAAKLGGISSYKFKMTMQGGSYGSLLSVFGGSGATGDAAFVLSGTVVTAPEKASDVSFGGMRIVSIGGFDYMDISGTGTFYKSASKGNSMADSFSPATMFGSSVGSSTAGYTKVASESKNGVNADHYSADKAALGQYSKTLDATATKWTADVWVATQGGYPVSTAIIGSDDSGKVVFQLVFDITNINDSSNNVTAPTTLG